MVQTHTNNHSPNIQSRSPTLIPLSPSPALRRFVGRGSVRVSVGVRIWSVCISLVLYMLCTYRTNIRKYAQKDDAVQARRIPLPRAT